MRDVTRRSQNMACIVFFTSAMASCWLTCFLPSAPGVFKLIAWKSEDFGGRKGFGSSSCGNWNAGSIMSSCAYCSFNRDSSRAAATAVSPESAMISFFISSGNSAHTDGSISGKRAEGTDFALVAVAFSAVLE